MDLQRPTRALSLLFGALLLPLARVSAQGPISDHVILISIDGLRSDAVFNLGPQALPNLHRLRSEGSGTENARTDVDFSITLPNHTSMLTGHPVLGPAGHNWTTNAEPLPNETLHANNGGTYVAGVFDVVHDHGGSTALYASKSKFSIFDQSYDALNGRADTVGADDGNAKIDWFVVNEDNGALVAQLTADLAVFAWDFTFLHLSLMDVFGHAFLFDPTPGSFYSDQLLTLDALLGQIFDLVEVHPSFIGATSIILTSDHGGIGNNHVTAWIRDCYTVPFHVWGPGIASNTDLYFENPLVRTDPGPSRPSLSGPQPVRNGDAANLALTLLGLPDVDGSTLNAGSQRLNPFGPPNLSPIATIISAPAANGSAFAVDLDGSGSFDPDGSLTDWFWWFSDGSLDFGPTPTHTFAGPGSYTANLLVWDDRGAVALAVATVVVAPVVNGPPVVTVSPASGAVAPGTSLVVTLDDPDGLGDLSAFALDLQVVPGGPWYAFFIPEIIPFLTFDIDPLGRFRITWSDLGIWVDAGLVPIWNFRATLVDSLGQSAQATANYHQAP